MSVDTDILDPVRALARQIRESGGARVGAEEACRQEAVRTGRAVAERMIIAGLTTPAALLRVLEDLRGMIMALGVSDDESTWSDVVLSVVRTHTELVQVRLLADQEAVHRATVAARERAEAELRASEARFRALFEDAPVGIGIGSIEGLLLEANEALQSMLGYSRQEMYRLGVRSFMHPDDAAEIWQSYLDLVCGQRDLLRTEKRLLRRDGTVIWADISFSLIRSADGRPSYQIVVLQDISGRRALQDQLHHAATHDSLTGLPNRNRFLERLEELTRRGAPPVRVGLCFLDLDGFKMLNDVGGQLFGDLVLREVADRLRWAMADTGAMVARLGGDEFVVLSAQGERAADESPDPASGGRRDEGIGPDRLAARLLEALRVPMELEGSLPVDVRASVGVVELPSVEATAENLLQAANLAMREAKEQGKGRVVVHDPSRTARQLTRVSVALGLPGAVGRGELDVVYQPMVRLDDGSLHGVEALVRWRHPELGELMPQQFIPAAEASGDIVALGEWVFCRACTDLADHDWPAVNVNLSVRQLHRPELADHVRSCLARLKIDPARVRVELTETLLLSPEDALPLQALHELADVGVRLVMDDFGIGYSNLAALARLPLDELKLAGTFIEPMLSRGPDESDSRVFGSLVDLAHGLGMTVTAEGIETAEQADWVRAHGCDIGQGWFFGRHVDA